jgi:hypothetical protein
VKTLIIIIIGSLIKRLDDSESDFLTHLQQENSKQEQEKKRLEGEQIDAFRKSFPLPTACYCLVFGDSVNGRAQSAIGVVRPSVQDIVPPPPPPPQRRSSSNIKGVLVKRKSDSQGGDAKRRRSSTTESPRIEKTPPIPSPSPTSTTPASTLISHSSVPKNGNTQGGLAGFDDYSDSDED